MSHRAVSDTAFVILVILYALVIIVSVMGNVLVITAVLRSPHMRKVSMVLLKYSLGNTTLRSHLIVNAKEKHALLERTC